MNQDEKKKRLQVLQQSRPTAVKLTVDNAPRPYNITVSGAAPNLSPMTQRIGQAGKQPNVIGRFANSITDLINANSAKDIQKRTIAGMPAMYKDQQKLMARDNVQSVAENPFKRVFQEVTEAPRRIGFGVAQNTSQADKVRQSYLDLQTTQNSNLLKAQQKLKDPKVSQKEKQRWYDYLVKEYPNIAQNQFDTNIQLQKDLKDADPVAGLAALAEMGLDVATLGASGVVIKGGRTAAKQGVKELAKYTGKNILKPVIPGAAGGAIGAFTSQGSDTTPQQVAAGAAAGAAFGIAIPVVGYGLGEIGGKVLSKITNSSNADEIATILSKEATQELSEEEAKTFGKLLANETDPEVVKTILKSVDESAPRVASTATNAITDVITAAKSVDKPSIAKFVKESFPGVTKREEITLINKIAKTTNPDEVTNIINEQIQRKQQVTQALDQAVPETPAQTPTEALEQAVTETPPNANISQATPTTATPDGTPNASADIAQGDIYTVAEDAAKRAEDIKGLYGKETIADKAKKLADPLAPLRDIDRAREKALGIKKYSLPKTQSLEHRAQVTKQAAESARADIKQTNTYNIIQKYGYGTPESTQFNVYTIQLRDLQDRANGRPAIDRRFNTDDLQRLVTEYESVNPTARQDAFTLARDMEALQDKAVREGALQAEDLDIVRTNKDGSRSEFWTPIERAKPEDVASQITTGNGITTGRNKILQQTTGSDLPATPTFDRITDYFETVYKQIEEVKTGKLVKENVQAGIIPGARVVNTGEDVARMTQIRKSITELRDITKSLQKEKGKVQFRTRASAQQAKQAQKQVNNRVREILRDTVDDADAQTAIASMPDQDLTDLMRIFNEPDIKKTPNVQRIYDSFVKKSETHQRLAERLEDIKLDMESLDNAKKGLGRELIDVRPDPTTGRQTVVGIDENGQNFRLEIPPKYASVIMGADKEKMNALLRGARFIQQPWRESYTGILNPPFQVAQATFNTIWAGILAGPKVYGPKAVKAALSALNANSLDQQLLRGSGAVVYGGNLQKLVDDTTAKAIASQADALGKIKWNLNPKRAWEQLSTAGGKIDQMARAAVAEVKYNNALKKGLSEADAQAAKVYSYNNDFPNFQNAADLVKQIDSAIPYSGAAQTGSRAAIRALRENPAVAGRLAVFTTGVAGLVAYNLSQDAGEEFYKDMESSGKKYVLDNNLVWVLPGARKDPKTGEWSGVVLIPLTPELRPFASAINSTFSPSETGVPVKRYATAVFDFFTGGIRTNRSPLIQTAYGATTGVDPSTGREIYDETMTPEEKRKATGEYFVSTFGLPGKVATKGISEVPKAFVDRVYGAKGLSDGGQYYKNEKDVFNQLQLSRNERDAYTSVVAPRSKDLAGNTIKDKTYYDSSARAEIWQKYPKTFEASRLMDAKNREAGKPGDPLYDLDPQQLKLILNMQANYSPGNKEDESITLLNPWIKDFNKKRSGFFDQIQANMTPEQRAQTGVDPMGLKIPKATPDVQAKIDQSSQLTDAAAKAQFYRDNPEVSDYFAEQNNYQRAKRSFLGLPQFDNYPTPTKEVQSIIDQYNKLPKGNGPIGKTTGKPTSPARSAWIKANPEKFAQMNEQWSRQDIYRLQEEGSLAVYEGIDFTEQGIKSIQDLAKALGVSSGSYGSNGYGTGGGSAAKDYMGIMKLLSGIDTTLPTAPTINQRVSTPKLRFKQPFTGAKPKLRVQLKT